MTSIFTSQPRQSFPTVISHDIRQQNDAAVRGNTKVDPGQSQPRDSNFYKGGRQDDIENEEERPSKRRRVGTHSSGTGPMITVEINDDSPQATSLDAPRYVLADWTDAVVERKPRRSNLRNGVRESSPLPQPQWTKKDAAETTSIRVRTPCRYRADVPVPNRPESLKCTNATLLGSKKAADYFPWTGKHSEDVINESTVKNGYWDRAPHPPDKELNTARNSLHNVFKHRSGLENLSALFEVILEKQAKHNALNSTSTFRPPPRVTLTEAKRRSWIVELADNDVPLRKLSRTIPQGIRGLQLLEQCLSHKVPINRAVWFVKCVGANEIRTLKRKGVNTNLSSGAEVKWLRDWTINIEQFLESIINQIGQPDWLPLFQYCLRMSARLYQENLLDRDHFLDWIVNKLTNCTFQMLATWFILFQAFSKDFFRFRRRAQLAASALLQRLADVFSQDTPTPTLGDQCLAVIRSVFVLRPAAFVAPDRWSELRNALESCLDTNDSQHKLMFECVQRRNQRLLGRDPEENGILPPVRPVYDVLDAATAPFAIDQLGQDLSACLSSSEQLADCCLDWATSRYRGGKYRVYLVVRLIRRWQRMGRDVEQAVLRFFSRAHLTASLDVTNYRHLFAELSRTNNFSKSRFLQMLSIHGDTEDGEEQRLNNVVLLGDLHLEPGEEHLVNLRDHLYHQSTRSSPQNTDSITWIARLRESIDAVEIDSQPSIAEKIRYQDLQNLGWAARMEVAVWLRAEAVTQSRYASVEIPGKPALPGSRHFSLSQFLVMRKALDAIGDIAILADIVQCLSNTIREEILAALVDTMHYHATGLSAIGALAPLQKLYGQAYIMLRQSRPSLLSLAISLADLCQSFPCPTTPLRALQQDIVRGDRGRALAACSPFSNGVAESLQQAGATFIEDFEAILLGEPNMSEQTLTSLFGVLVSRIMRSGGDEIEQSTSTLCQLLLRLRLVRPTHGDVLIRKWLSRLFSAAWSGIHQNIVQELLFTRCATFESLLDVATQAPLASRCKQAIRDMIATSLLSNHPDNTNPQHCYVYSLAAHRFIGSDPVRGLDILLSQNDRGDDMLRQCAAILPGLLKDERKLSGLSPIASKSLVMTIDELLDLRVGRSNALTQLMARVNCLSLPYCSYRMPALVGGPNNDNRDQPTLDRAENIYSGLRLQSSDSGLQPDTAQALLASMPAELQDQVRSIAEHQFYNSLPKFLAAKTIGQGLSSNQPDKEKSLLAVKELVALGHSRHSSAALDGNVVLIEKLTVSAKLLGIRSDAQAANTTGTPVTSPATPALHTSQTTMQPSVTEAKSKESILTIIDYVDMLLRVVCLKMKALGTSQALGAMNKSTQHDQIRLAVLVASIATQPSLTNMLTSNYDDWSKNRIQDCVTFALDIASCIVDDLSDEGRNIAARIMKDRMKDERLVWLLGSMATCAAVNNPAGHGLMLVQQTKGTVVEFRPKPWELLESGGGKESDTCLGLGLFGARRI